MSAILQATPNEGLVVLSPAGPLRAGWSGEGLAFLDFVDQAACSAPTPNDDGSDVPNTPSPVGLAGRLRRELTAYLAGSRADFTIPLAPRGTHFQHQVWNALRTIPPGQTRSYADVARMIGRPSAVRAVARANATNPIAIIIPCHRVIGADGSLAGYAAGLDRKRWLLDHEARFWGSSPAPQPGSLFGADR